MKPTQTFKKPFGLSLACKIAAQALHDNVAPASVIVGNLFFLQTSTQFPKELDVNFFATQKRMLTDMEKRILVQALPELKKPAFQIPELLENLVKDNWVKKVAPAPAIAQKTTTNKKKVVKRPVVKEVTAPVIIVKKNKLT